MIKIAIYFSLLANIVFSSELYYMQEDEKITLEKINVLSRSVSSIDYYQTSLGDIVGVSKALLVKFKNIDNLQTYLNEYDLSIVKIIDENLYLLASKSKETSIQIASTLHKKDDVLYAHPDFVRTRSKR